MTGGIGTPHLDGNTRLCTATADFALKETFGTDGASGSLTDFDECDTIFSVGHNIAETHTVLWARILDRLHGPDWPRLVVVDPRRTRIARERTSTCRSATAPTWRCSTGSNTSWWPTAGSTAASSTPTPSASTTWRRPSPAMAAKAVRDRELLDVASGFQQEAEARGKWLRTRIKESSPQVLATG